MEAVRRKKLAVGVALVLGFSMLPISQAPAKTFKNCTELNKKYPGGVALPGALTLGQEKSKRPWGLSERGLLSV